jgi:signal transduction histidine kinase
MYLYANNEEVARLDAALLIAKGAARLPFLVPLAWYLRQSDSARSLLLMQEIPPLLDVADLPPSERTRIEARLLLLRAEIKWLSTDLQAAVVLAEAALHQFSPLHDHEGCADAHWLLGWIAMDMGDFVRRKNERHAAVAAARLAQDAVRVDMTEAAIACSDALHDAKDASLRWNQRFWPDMPGLQEPAVLWVYDFLAIVAFLQSDFGTAAAYWMHAYEAAIATGQVRRAIATCTNIGDAFNSLNEHHGALDWMQRALDLARQYAWSGSLGICLTQTGETMRRLGRVACAEELHHEALAVLRPLASSRNYATALAYLAELKLQQEQYQDALQLFQEFQVRAKELNQHDFQTLAQRGLAHALLHLDQAPKALTAASSAFALARQYDDSSRQIDALQVLAQIHARQLARNSPLPLPEGLQVESAVLHYLLLAQDLASMIPGYQMNGELYDALATEYARLRQFEKAWEFALLAKQARTATQTQEANHRAVALQVQQQTERVRADISHNQQLASAEAQRAEVLQQTTITLERLGAIGQEICSQLDRNVVFRALNRHVHSLMDANSFMIFLLDPDGNTLSRAFGYEDGKPIPKRTIAFSNTKSDSIRCLRERREILLDISPDDATNLIPDTLHTLTALFGPLMIGDRIIGVLSAQSVRRFAFGERERLVFRTLCAYGAIALDNAFAYQKLQEAQQHMVGQEKLAALGALVAGVAHELNTPIGNCLMIASSFQNRTDEMRHRMQSPTLQRSELNEFIDDAEDAATIIMRGLTSAVELVKSFKQVAVDRTTSHRREFDLARTTHELLATMMNQIKISGHSITQDIATGIVLNSYPGPYGQVIANLVNNAMLHAFEGRTGGQMHLAATLVLPGRVRITFTDDGNGISEQNMQRIFEPFFTTKMGQGGSGLGLSISQQIVTSLLSGKLECQSPPGQGTTFILDLPLEAPQQLPWGE